MPLLLGPRKNLHKDSFGENLLFRADLLGGPTVTVVDSGLLAFGSFLLTSGKHPFLGGYNISREVVWMALKIQLNETQVG